jgi:mono/diheme cytochrome c family protein
MPMKSRGLIYFGAALMLAAALLLGVVAESTRAQAAAEPDPARGAMLYDKWYAVLGVQPPAGNMPIWNSQKTNTHSGEDTWRCAACHGWDYQGKDGAYRSGSYFTGFPGVYAAGQAMKVEEIVAVLKGQKDPEHDFSKYLDDASLNDLAAFIKTGLVDDSSYIDPLALTVKDGNLDQGKSFYTSQCASCHGEDGAKISIRINGRNSALGAVAFVDPWRFLHKTRFGSPGAAEKVGHDPKWTIEQARDVLAYARTLPNGLVATAAPPTVGGELPEISGKGPAGQSQNFFVGIATAIGAIFTGLGFAVILGAFLIGVIFVIVYSLRERKK